MPESEHDAEPPTQGLGVGPVFGCPPDPARRPTEGDVLLVLGS